ncbi:hypothetical protein JCM1840_003990 [Sporobolomyces johnsonii]
MKSTALLVALAGLAVGEATAATAINYTQVEWLQGSSLAAAFNWETGNFDNGGIANYVPQVVARRLNLWAINGLKQNVFRVQSTPNQALRNSTRISSKKSYSGGGLFVFDVAHIPVGLWPAIWMVGVPTWPDMGEIDIIEGVHTTTQNTQSFHTGTGCYQGTAGFTNTYTLSGDLAYDCYAYAADNQGCSTRDGSQKSYGAPFNAKGGGVFAVKWNTRGIAIYSWARDSIPADVAAGAPTGVGWGTPTDLLLSDNCDIMSHFYEMKMVINTNLCGTWAGGVWDDDLSYAGAPGSPANATRVSTCNAYIQRGGYNAVKDAYWAINSIAIYNTTST